MGLRPFSTEQTMKNTFDNTGLKTVHSWTLILCLCFERLDVLPPFPEINFLQWLQTPPFRLAVVTDPTIQTGSHMQPHFRFSCRHRANEKTKANRKAQTFGRKVKIVAWQSRQSAKSLQDARSQQYGTAHTPQWLVCGVSRRNWHRNLTVWARV